MEPEVKAELIEKMTDNLPTLRAKISLTQAKLAEMIGTSRQTVVAIENKKKEMSWSTFLSCYFVFSNNPHADQLLRLYNIRTIELDNFLSANKKEK